MNINAIRIIKSDLKTIEKLEQNPNHKVRIKEAKQAAKDLKINCESVYYSYQTYLKQLEGVGFLELSALDRFSDQSYYIELVDLYKRINPNSQPKESYSKVIQFKPHKFKPIK